MTVVSATLEVEAEGFLEFGVSKPIWATQWKLMSKKKERGRKRGREGRRERRRGKGRKVEREGGRVLGNGSVGDGTQT